MLASQSAIAGASDQTSQVCGTSVTRLAHTRTSTMKPEIVARVQTTSVNHAATRGLNCISHPYVRVCRRRERAGPQPGERRHRRVGARQLVEPLDRLCRHFFPVRSAGGSRLGTW